MGRARRWSLESLTAKMKGREAAVFGGERRKTGVLLVKTLQSVTLLGIFLQRMCLRH